MASRVTFELEPSEERWMDYLDELELRSDPLAQAVASRVCEIAAELAVQLQGQLRPPTAIIEDGEQGIAMTWDTVRYTTEIYVHASGATEWSFHDRQTKSTDGSDGGTLTKLPPRFFVQLAQLLATR